MRDRRSILLGRRREAGSPLTLAALAAFAVTFASPAPSHALVEGRRLALVIGINTFEDGRWPALRYAERDAADMGRALGKAFDRVITLTERPTRARVLAALDELARGSTSDRDTVVVYVSTHGTLAYDARGALHRVLVLSDTREEVAFDTALTQENLLERVDRARSRRKLVIIASCHSGAGKSQLPADLARDLRSLKGAFFAEPEIAPGEGRIVLAASAWGETAREDEGLGHDVYTHFFLEALAGFDLDQDGATTALEAHEYARRRTLEFTKGRQRPSLTAELVGEDPIILAGERRRAGHPMIATWAASFAGGVLEVDGREKGALPGSYPVESGERHIRVLKPGGVVLERALDVAPGQTVLLEHLLDRPDRPWLQLTAGFRMRGVRSGEISEGYLPARPTAVTGASWVNGDETLRLGLELGVSHQTQRVSLPDPLAGRFVTPVTLTLFDVAATADYGLWSWGPLSVEGSVRVGTTFGTRSFEIDTVAARSQVISLAWGGLGAGLSWAATEVIGLRASAFADVLIPSIEGSLRPVFSDSYQVGVWVRP